MSSNREASFIHHVQSGPCHTFPAAHWVLELMDAREEIERATGVKVTSANIASFQERVAKHFITDLKNNIVCRFTFQDVVSSFSIFDPEKIPPLGHNRFILLWERSYSRISACRRECKPALVSSDIT